LPDSELEMESSSEMEDEDIYDPESIPDLVLESDETDHLPEPFGDSPGDSSELTLRDLDPDQFDNMPVAEAPLPSDDSVMGAAPTGPTFPIRKPVLPQNQFEAALGKISTDELLALFNYFKSITRSLPNDNLSEYLLSEERIKLEYVIDRLSGKTGLKDDERVFRIRRKLATSEGETICTSPGVSMDFDKTIEFLHGMVKRLPDEGFVLTFSNKLDRIKDEYDQNVIHDK